MKTSTEIAEITDNFLNAQRKIKAAVKNVVNPFFHKSYADLTSVIEACKKELNENGIVVLQPINGMEVETILIHTSGEWFSSTTPIVCKAQNDPQALGSAISYARRYGLQSMVLLPSEDDDGNVASKATATKTVQESTDPTEEWIPPEEELVDEHVCHIHSVKMKERTRKDGTHWFDHRQEVNGDWQVCNGKGWNIKN